MIAEVTMYRVVCDAEDCDDSPSEGSEFYAWAQPDGALGDLDDSYDWYASGGGKHYCPTHAPVCSECGGPLDNDEFGDRCEDCAALAAPSFLAWATAAAERYHQGQVDKVGEPYIGHPARVAAACREAGFGDEVVAVAWLHDTVEDTDLTLGAIRLACGDAIADAVDALTKRKGEKFETYYERVKANEIATAVKWHDVADNADPRRLAKVAPDTQERLRAKYERACVLLGWRGDDSG